MLHTTCAKSGTRIPLVKDHQQTKWHLNGEREPYLQHKWHLPFDRHCDRRDSQCRQAIVKTANLHARAYGLQSTNPAAGPFGDVSIQSPGSSQSATVPSAFAAELLS
ncbi:hypothetical protein [Ktedonospora formicarum]|uniref:hypothetical protein n=1 Tax=Ktedonospora formicarum TaxID=2778364 RepID=UPI001C68A7BB|nr:hypothetical protein [Ktedonospora formicarum]